MSRDVKIAVILSGCGVFDGSEIHETVATLLAIDKFGYSYQCFAPDIMQAKVIDHKTGQASALQGDEDRFQRNVLSESARISRGNCLPLSEYDSQEFDAIVFPGGFGAAMNLCSFAEDGIDCKVNQDVENAIKSSFEREIPICALCIAPAVIAKVLGENGIKITIGNDKSVSSAIEKTGASHVEKEAFEVLIDEENKIITSPCYMLAKTITEVFEGAENAIEAIGDMV